MFALIRRGALRGRHVNSEMLHGGLTGASTWTLAASTASRSAEVGRAFDYER